MSYWAYDVYAGGADPIDTLWYVRYIPLEKVQEEVDELAKPADDEVDYQMLLYMHGYSDDLPSVEDKPYPHNAYAKFRAVYNNSEGPKQMAREKNDRAPITS